MSLVGLRKTYPFLQAHVDGVNMKLMKCGGITEAYELLQQQEHMD